MGSYNKPTSYLKDAEKLPRQTHTRHQHRGTVRQTRTPFTIATQHSQDAAEEYLTHATNTYHRTPNNSLHIPTSHPHQHPPPRQDRHNHSLSATYPPEEPHHRPPSSAIRFPETSRTTQPYLWAANTLAPNSTQGPSRVRRVTGLAHAHVAQQAHCAAKTGRQVGIASQRPLLCRVLARKCGG
jgi:hypothetical protein